MDKVERARDQMTPAQAELFGFVCGLHTAWMQREELMRKSDGSFTSMEQMADLLDQVFAGVPKLMRLTELTVGEATLPNPVSDTCDLGGDGWTAEQDEACAQACIKAAANIGGYSDKACAAREKLRRAAEIVRRSTRDLGIQEERDIRPAVLEVLRRHRSTGESQEVIARDITTAVRAVLHGSTLERDTVGGEAVRKAKAAMSPLVDGDMPEPMRDAWLTDLAVAALSPASTDIGALREVLERIDEFVRKYFQPWGAWKTVWWEGEVAGDAAFSDNNALKHVANIAKQALSATPANGRGDA